MSKKKKKEFGDMNIGGKSLVDLHISPFLSVMFVQLAHLDRSIRNVTMSHRNPFPVTWFGNQTTIQITKLTPIEQQRHCPGSWSWHNPGLSGIGLALVPYNTAKKKVSP